MSHCSKMLNYKVVLRLWHCKARLPQIVSRLTRESCNWALIYSLCPLSKNWQRKTQQPESSELGVATNASKILISSNPPQKSISSKKSTMSWLQRKSMTLSEMQPSWLAVKSQMIETSKKWAPQTALAASGVRNSEEFLVLRFWWAASHRWRTFT